NTGAKPLFGEIQSNATPQASTQTSAAPTSSLFGTLNQNKEAGASTSAPASSTATASTLFGQPNQQNTNATPTSSAAPNSNLSAASGQSKDTATATSTAPGTGATTSTQAPAASFFGAAASKPAETSSTTQPTTSGPAASTTTAPNLAVSTSGPAPPPQSRLKNKSMDEIITRWASDLSTYQKEFQSQAEKVASWDRMLVENSDKISKLYSKTFQAERDTAEVERQLSDVEGQQEELEQWLDRYEREVDELMDRLGAGAGGEGLQGVDQERERTYKLAERLSERLGEMGRDLTSMIEEINLASAKISKTSRPDDPLSHIVRILNSHLAQLQQIDAGATSLAAKVEAAESEGARIGLGRGGAGAMAVGSGLGGDAADDFYRSYLGRK
ncbi:hypothetical protein LTR04_003976, partial [Oleoguttula sp. CCFEE 6159]